MTNVLAHVAVSVAFLHISSSSVVFGNRQLAFMASLLFAAHPVHTEAVCGIWLGKTIAASPVFTESACNRWF